MEIEVYVNKMDDNVYDVDVYELNGDRDEDLTKNDFDSVESAEKYVDELINNKDYDVLYLGVSE